VTKPHGIFISYRREQAAAHAGRIYDHLCDAFGQDTVFMDVGSIGLGLDFGRVLDEAVSSCVVMLVLIGPRWAEISDERGRRLDDPNDFVRQEVEAGLRREIPVVPVLLSGAALPQPEELPEGIRPLVGRQQLRLLDETFRSQAQGLVEELRPLVVPGSLETPLEPGPGWTAELIDKSHRHRVLRVRLARDEHVVTYKVGALSATLRVDDEGIARKFVPTGEKQGDPDVVIEFQLDDGDASRSSTFQAYYAGWSSERAALIVGRADVVRRRRDANPLAR
jgi:TIR domain